MEQLDYSLVSAETKLFMTDVCDLLDDILQPCDLGAIRGLMVSYEFYKQATDRLLKEGILLTDKKGRTTVNPANAVAKSYQTQVMNFMREYGLTLRSRQAIKAMNADVDEDNPLAQYLKNEDAGL